MDDESMPLPAHVTLRNGVYQYVRRIPDDIVGAFASPRIQRSLKTRLPSEARLRGARIDIEIEKQFADVRAKRGLRVEPVINEGWIWPDWERAFLWLTATWIEEDTEVRARLRTGRHVAAPDNETRTVWLPNDLLREKIKLRADLLSMTATDYGKARGSFVQRYLTRIGVSASVTSPYYDRIMGGCLTAELAALEVTFSREGGTWSNHPHPDAIDGPWRKSVEPIEVSSAVAQVVEDAKAAGPSLSVCIDEWIRDRVRLRKKIDDHLVRDMRATTKWFSDFTKISDVTSVERKHVIAFRDHLTDGGKYKVATVNKKTGYITTLVATAAGKGWRHTSIEGGVYIDIAENENKRDSYSREELGRIFAHPVFTSGERSRLAKAGGELQFWLPLISCLHGLISSEILQLGPDTVCVHPDADIPCFRVTTAGGRAIKAYSRERYVPIRSELQQLGFMDLVEHARSAGWKSLWEPVEEKDGNVSLTSNYFSAFWSDFQRDELGVKDETKSLYSFRHSFKDALDRAKTDEEVRKALMGHAEQGTTARYGAKREPKPVNIKMLKRAIQKLEWPFLSSVSATISRSR